MIKIEVTGESIAEVSDKLLAIGNSLRGAPAQPAPAPKAAKAEKAAPLVVAEPATPPVVVPVATLDFDTDVAPHVLQVVKVKGKPAAQAILHQFGVEKASLLDTALWPELVLALQAAL